MKARCGHLCWDTLAGYYVLLEMRFPGISTGDLGRGISLAEKTILFTVGGT